MIYIIIPVFNRKDFTRMCLESLRNQTNQLFKVVVVDDGSTDGTAEMLKTDFPEVITLRGDGNLWWTASINKGIEFALQEKAQYILTLNNDTVATADFIENMAKWTVKFPDASFGALALDYYSKKPVYGGGNIKWITASTQYLLNTLKKDEFHGIHPVDHFPGRGLLIPKNVFDKIGLFKQETFPHYFADYDFTQQLVKNGFQLFCNFDAKLFIFPDESGDRKNRGNKSIRKYYNHLFGIKGGGNLKNFTKFAFRNCPPFYLPFFITFGYIKRIFGYLIK